MASISFEALWNNHPSNQHPPIETPCVGSDGSSHFENQCAIRMGECLHKSGISMDTYHGTFCWYNHERRHPIRAEQVGRWLNSGHAFVNEVDIAVRKEGGQRPYNSYTGKTGIVLLKNFWGANNQGDHIDLWDGSVLAHGRLDYFVRSQEIWFWPVR